MKTLYTVKYNAYAREIFADTSTEEELNQVLITLEYSPRYYDIIKTESINTPIRYTSHYMGVTDYEYFKNGQWSRFSIQTGREEWNATAWNYQSEEDFEREYNGRLNHVWGFCGEPIPEEVFYVIKKIHPSAINGL